MFYYQKNLCWNKQKILSFCISQGPNVHTGKSPTKWGEIQVESQNLREICISIRSVVQLSIFHTYILKKKKKKPYDYSESVHQISDKYTKDL